MAGIIFVILLVSAVLLFLLFMSTRLIRKIDRRHLERPLRITKWAHVVSLGVVLLAWWLSSYDIIFRWHLDFVVFVLFLLSGILLYDFLPKGAVGGLGWGVYATLFYWACGVMMLFWPLPVIALTNVFSLDRDSLFATEHFEAYNRQRGYAAFRYPYFRVYERKGPFLRSFEGFGYDPFHWQFESAEELDHVIRVTLLPKERTLQDDREDDTPSCDSIILLLRGVPRNAEAAQPFLPDRTVLVE